MSSKLPACVLLLAALATAHAEERYEPRFARTSLPAVMMMKNCGKPAWPRSSLQNGETGRVTLGFLVAPTGEILEAKIVKSSGFRTLDNAAITGMIRCKFRPASIDGIPVQSTAQLQYVWTLE